MTGFSCLATELVSKVSALARGGFVQLTEVMAQRIYKMQPETMIGTSIRIKRIHSTVSGNLLICLP